MYITCTMCMHGRLYLINGNENTMCSIYWKVAFVSVELAAMVGIYCRVASNGIHVNMVVQLIVVTNDILGRHLECTPIHAAYMSKTILSNNDCSWQRSVT